MGKRPALRLATMPSWPGRPAIVCVEVLACSGVLAKAVRHQQIPLLMDDLGFEKVADTFVNSIFVDRDVWA